ncbi:MAG TPA: hypothetical protein VKM94_18540 [Blastocatellia bacterium]|nr:hypothetical protein [Blastocatellia bacterium]
MKRKTSLLALGALVLYTLLSTAEATISTEGGALQKRAEAGFASLKALAGDWEDKGRGATLTYQVISGGSAVMETHRPAGEPTMTSIYHLDGDRLVMTHYCSAGNQPRMESTVPAGEIRQLSFSYVSATNLAKTTDGHIHSVQLSFPDGDHLTVVWTWREGSDDSRTTFQFVRKAGR